METFMALPAQGEVPDMEPFLKSHLPGIYSNQIA
jgi:hypothetical protein